MRVFYLDITALDSLLIVILDYLYYISLVNAFDYNTLSASLRRVVIVSQRLSVFYSCV